MNITKGVVQLIHRRDFASAAQATAVIVAKRLIIP